MVADGAERVDAGTLVMDVFKQSLNEPAAFPPRGSAPPVPHLTLEAESQGLRLNLREIWEYRELLVFLAWRDVKVRYRQTALGAAWAILQPLVAMVIFSVVFGQLAKLPSDGIPYPIFTFVALLPWNLFSSALARATSSLVSSANLISKVYFPRVLVPMAAMVSALVDFFFSFLILLGMMVVYGVTPTWRLLTLPFFILLALGAGLGIGLWLSALNVRYRDVSYIIPFVIQVWLYASPVAYSSTLVPREWQWL
jgi:lipopolysaccharide transport system permease protein